MQGFEPTTLLNITTVGRGHLELLLSPQRSGISSNFPLILGSWVRIPARNFQKIALTPTTSSYVCIQPLGHKEQCLEGLL